MKLNTLRDLYIHTLQDLYSAETQITKALPKMAKAVSSPDLKQAFEMHLTQTEEHLRRLDQIFEQLGRSKNGKKCKGMEGLIEEGQEILEEDADPQVVDAALIAAAQKVEHYEISGYGTARTYAQMLGEKDAARLLQQTLNEEGETDKKLTQLAERQVNVEAK